VVVVGWWWGWWASEGGGVVLRGMFLPRAAGGAPVRVGGSLK
jgi:hypothetical protein